MNFKLDQLRNVISKSKENEESSSNLKQDVSAPPRRRKRKRDSSQDDMQDENRNNPFPRANGILRSDSSEKRKKLFDPISMDKHVHFDKETVGSSLSSSRFSLLSVAIRPEVGSN